MAYTHHIPYLTTAVLRFRGQLHAASIAATHRYFPQTDPTARNYKPKEASPFTPTRIYVADILLVLSRVNGATRHEATNLDLTQRVYFPR